MQLSKNFLPLNHVPLHYLCYAHSVYLAYSNFLQNKHIKVGLEIKLHFPNLNCVCYFKQTTVLFSQLWPWDL